MDEFEISEKERKAFSFLFYRSYSVFVIIIMIIINSHELISKECRSVGVKNEIEEKALKMSMFEEIFLDNLRNWRGRSE